MARKKANAGDRSGDISLLLQSASELPQGRARIGLLEEAVRIADAHGDVELGYDCRQQLIEAATFGGSPEISLVAFAWCLAQADKDPERYENYDLLWRYKWIADQAPAYPQVTMSQIREMFEDLEKRFLRNGSGQHPIQQQIRSLAVAIGDLEAAKRAHAIVQASTPSYLSDCPACEVDTQIEFYIQTDQPIVALQKAEPIFAGRLTCAEVPHRTYARVLVSLVLAGELERAASYHARGYRLIGSNPKFIAFAAEHLLFLTLTDNLAKGVRALERHLPNALSSTCPDWKFPFYRAAAFLLDRVAESGKRLRVRLPEDFPATVDRASPVALRDWFLSEARTIATAFDARNGNDWYARKLNTLSNLKLRITPYPLDLAK